MNLCEKIINTINNHFVIRISRETLENTTKVASFSSSLWLIVFASLEFRRVGSSALRNQCQKPVSFSTFSQIIFRFKIGSMFKFFDTVRVRSIYQFIVRCSTELGPCSPYPALLAISMLSPKHVFSLCNILYNIHLTAWFEGTRTSRSRPSNEEGGGGRKKKRQGFSFALARGGTVYVESSIVHGNTQRTKLQCTCLTLHVKYFTNARTKLLAFDAICSRRNGEGERQNSHLLS